MDGEQRTLERLAAGDAGAVDDLLNAHMPDLRTFVRLRAGAFLRDHESSSDLVQSVCREILTQRERFQYPGQEGFRRWLYTTVMRKISKRAEHHRAQCRDVRRNDPLGDEGHGGALLDSYRRFGSPSAGMRASEEMARIEAVFDRLPEDYREVVTLARIAGLPHREIAERMGRSEGSVRMLLFRALEQLFELLE
ncbi:MAG: RNA polymerase sigma-70 factor (ECF subfamily) [Chlamydiales bacterium]|jgi:RNA polymerase sigma-70 factor (ECF subfamily)